MSSSGNAASKMLIAWPNFIAPPLSCPSTEKIWSAVRRCTSLRTTFAGAPTMRLPRPSVVRPANPTGSDARRAVRRNALPVSGRPFGSPLPGEPAWSGPSGRSGVWGTSSG